MLTNCDEWNILLFFAAIFDLSMRAHLPPSVDGVKAVSEGGVGRLQLVYLLLAVPDLKKTMKKGRG